MKPSEIQVGKTYINRGIGLTRRTVLEISKDLRPFWSGDPMNRPDEPGVRYRDNRGREYLLYLSSFARWVGGEVPE